MDFEVEVSLSICPDLSSPKASSGSVVGRGWC